MCKEAKQRHQSGLTEHDKYILYFTGGMFGGNVREECSGGMFVGNVRGECSGEMFGRRDVRGECSEGMFGENVRGGMRSEVSLTVKTARQREFGVAQKGKRNEMVSPFSLTKYIMTHLHTFSCSLR